MWLWKCDSLSISAGTRLSDMLDLRSWSSSETVTFLLSWLIHRQNKHHKESAAARLFSLKPPFLWTSRINGVLMTHRVTGVDVSTCCQVPVNHQQLLLITGLPEVVLIHIIRLRDTNTLITWAFTQNRNSRSIHTDWSSGSYVLQHSNNNNFISKAHLKSAAVQVNVL